MKRLLLIIFCILILSPCSFTASASVFLYAQIKEGANLLDDEGKVVCSLPATYFVTVTGEEEGGRLPVFYDGLEGFMASEDLSVVDYEPKYKYHSATLTFSNDGHKVNIRSLPSHLEGEVILEVNSNDTAEFLGSVKGSALFTAVGDEWHYVRIRKKGESVVGYVYSLYAQVDEILNNVIEKVEPNPPESTKNEEVLSSPSSPIREVVIILSLCLPALVGVYLIFRK